jgi:hypothetical protein
MGIIAVCLILTITEINILARHKPQPLRVPDNERNKKHHLDKPLRSRYDLHQNGAVGVAFSAFLLGVHPIHPKTKQQFLTESPQAFIFGPPNLWLRYLPLFPKG